MRPPWRWRTGQLVMSAPPLACLALLSGALFACQPDNPGAYDRIVLRGRMFRHEARAQGLVLERHRYQHGPSAGELWIAQLDPDLASISVEATRGGPTELANFVPAAGEGGPFVAINGGFYDKDGPLGLVVSDWVQLRRFRRDGGSGIFVISTAGPEIVHRDAFRPSPEVRHAVQSIDRLVVDGQIVVRQRPGLTHDARSLLAIDDDRHVYLLVLYDVRSVGRETDDFVYLSSETARRGPTLYDVAEFASRPRGSGGLGARWALNLDGGWSSAMLARFGGSLFGVVGYRGTVNAVQGRAMATHAP